MKYKLDLRWTPKSTLESIKAKLNELKVEYKSENDVILIEESEAHKMPKYDAYDDVYYIQYSENSSYILYPEKE